MTIRLFRETGAGGSGGLFLADITNEDGTPKSASDIKSGDGTPIIPDLGATPDPTKPAPDPAKPPGDAAPDPAKPGERDSAKPGEGEGDGTDDEPEEFEIPTPEEFFGTVEKLTGIPVEVQYPEGINPLSPEGIVVRDAAVRAQAALQFEKNLSEKYPRPYAYFLHHRAGKSDDDFLGARNAGFALPELGKLEESVDVQRQVYKQSLLAAGNDDEEAEALIEAAIKNNKLKERSKAAYTNIQTTHERQVQEQLDREQQEEEVYTQSVTTLKQTIAAKIAGSLNFAVPEAKQADFNKFVLENIQYENGKFIILQELNNDKLQTQLESLLFQFMNGDLSTLIQRKASTVVAQKLTLGIKRVKAPAPAGGTGGGIDKNNIPLSAHGEYLAKQQQQAQRN